MDYKYTTSRITGTVPVPNTEFNLKHGMLYTQLEFTSYMMYHTSSWAYCFINFSIK